MGTQNGLTTLEDRLALSQKFKHDLPYELGISLLGIHPGRTQAYVHTKSYTQMLVSAAKKLKQSKCPSEERLEE